MGTWKPALNQAGLEISTCWLAMMSTSCCRQWFIYNFGLMGPGTRCFRYQWVQLQTYESRTLYLMTSLRYDCILGLSELITLHPRDKIMRKRCRMRRYQNHCCRTSRNFDCFQCKLLNYKHIWACRTSRNLKNIPPLSGLGKSLMFNCHYCLNSTI